jgi:Uma2 family endonuclease
MTADEYFAQSDDGFDYELIDGVSVLSPSRSVAHQLLRAEVLMQISRYVEAQSLGEALFGLSLRLGPNLVYCPDINYFAQKWMLKDDEYPDFPPDLIVEILDNGTRTKDLRTKRDDYAKFGVPEYWALNQEEAWKFSLVNGAYTVQEIGGDQLPSDVIPGFVLDLKAARARLGS